MHRPQHDSEFIVAGEHLKSVTSHENQIKLLVPRTLTEVTENLIDI